MRSQNWTFSGMHFLEPLEASPIFIENQELFVEINHKYSWKVN